MNAQNSHRGHTRSRSCMELYSKSRGQPGSNAIDDYHYFVLELSENFRANQEFEPQAGEEEWEPLNGPIGPLKPPPRLQSNAGLISSNHRWEPPSRLKSNADSRNFSHGFRISLRNWKPFNGQDEPLEHPPRLQSNAGPKSYSQRFNTSSRGWEPLDSTIEPLRPSLRSQYNASPKHFSQKLAISSHKFPFWRMTTWSDDFDPFTVALQKVKQEEDEEEEESGQHPNTRSYLFRLVSMRPSSPMNQPQVPLRGQKSSQSVPGLSCIGKKHTDHNGPNKSKGKNARPNNERITNVAKLKATLQRHASFLHNKNRCKEINTTSEDQIPSFFSKLSFRQKGHASRL